MSTSRLATYFGQVAGIMGELGMSEVFGNPFDTIETSRMKGLPFRNPPSKSYPKSPDATYKKGQRKLRARTKQSFVLWVSCRQAGPLAPRYEEQGTYVKALHGPIGQNGIRREKIEQRKFARQAN